MDALATLSQAKAMLANCASIDGAKAIRDKASAIAAYLRQQGESFEAQNSAAEIRLRAERRLGELLAGMEKKVNGKSSACKLQELGIEHTQSHRWQRIASIPNAEFESYISTSKEGKRELTQAAVLKLANTTKSSSTKSSGDTKTELNLMDAIEMLNDSIRYVLQVWPKNMISAMGEKLISIGEEIRETGELV